MTAFCKERLVPFEYPRIVEVSAELPKMATGNVPRREFLEHEPCKSL